MISEYCEHNVSHISAILTLKFKNVTQLTILLIKIWTTKYLHNGKIVKHEDLTSLHTST